MLKNEKVNNTIEFEHDSSPEAWQFYKKIYFDKEGKCLIDKEYKLETGHELVFQNYPYNNIWKEKGNRLLLVKGLDECKIGAEYDGVQPTLSGECIFNFNKDKVGKLENLAEGDKAICNLINKCAGMHHTLLNMSLCQVKGNLQGYKSKCLLGEKETWLDRPDTFLYNLDKYLVKDKSKRKSDDLKNNAGKYNWCTLQEYLNLFDDVYSYASQHWQIDNDCGLIEQMIIEGEQPIKDKNGVVRYCELAKKFWNNRQANLYKSCKIIIIKYPS
jgi:hypothetical protein